MKKAKYAYKVSEHLSRKHDENDFPIARPSNTSVIIFNQFSLVFNLMTFELEVITEYGRCYGHKFSEALSLRSESRSIVNSLVTESPCKTVGDQAGGQSKFKLK